MKLSLCLRHSRRWYKLLQPARACLLASALVPVLFMFVGQGRDILHELVGEASYNEAHDPIYFRMTCHLTWMYLGLLTAGMTSWAWARFLLGYEFPGVEELEKINLESAKKWQRRLRRLCGILPPLGVAVGLFQISLTSPHKFQCWILIAGALAIVALLLLFFEQVRRRHVRVQLAEGRLEKRLHRYHSLGDVRENARVKWAIYSSWAVSILIFVALTASPVRLGQFLGSSAILLFAIASWLSVGSILIFVGDWHRVPAITLVLLWAVFCSFFNDNHRVRTLPAQRQIGVPMSFTNALELWHQGITNNYPLSGTQKTHPLYLVASAGGGIRAAYWTAIVLGELEDQAGTNRTSFAAHTFVMSGVSGGSLGEVTFTALKARGHMPNAGFRKSAGELLDEDFLAADLSKMAFADLLQRFLPCPIRPWDRARSLENAWADAWKTKMGDDTLNESLSELYADAAAANDPLPHLLLNGTCVETGQRIITSDLDIAPRLRVNGKLLQGGEFLDAIAASDKLENLPIRLCTAAHQSARFTYFSPPGRFHDGTHIVDGGYFENSGATTLMDALEAIKRYLRQQKWADVTPMLVLIDNEPIPLAPPNPRIPCLRESLAPVLALLNTRDARGDYAFQDAVNFRDDGLDYYEFHLYERPQGQQIGKLSGPAELPLGWALSRSAIEEMNGQLTTKFPFGTNIISNEGTILKIITTLPPARQHPTDPTQATSPITTK